MDETTRIDRGRLLDRFATGQALRGHLMRALVEDAGAGALLQPGARIGPWAIDELLGSGGMSHVYLAHRADGEFDQSVALKVVRRNADLIHRLRHERQLLGNLRHPHIVNLVDSGETNEGDLWLAMGLVEGQPIDRYVAERLLDWRARLRLVDDVCGAVEYAHGRGLIHRDIKPANVLIDLQGHPRLLDFGIAFEQGAQDAPDLALTPGYAAPEQLAGQPLTTATDVYQLGVLLRGVLVDDTGSLSMPPSVRADLLALIARATAEDPARRHPTVSALRSDLAALAARRPLAHQADSARIRWSRFAERNRLPLATAGTAACVLAAGLTVAALELRRERDNALANEARAQAIAQFLIDTLSSANPWRSSTDGGTVVEAMDRASERLDSELGQSLDVRRELRSVIASVYLVTDRYDRCLQLLSAPGLDAENAIATPLQRARQQILHAECQLATDAREPAWALLDAAEKTLEGTAGKESDSLRAWLLNERAQVRSLEGRFGEANAYLESAQAFATRGDAADQAYRATRQHAFNLLTATDFAAAAERFQRALELGKSVHGPTHRSTLTTAGGLAMTLDRLGRSDEAEALLHESIEAARSIRDKGGEPQITIAELRDNLATLYFQHARLDECIVEARAALETYARETPDSTRGYNPSWRVASCAYMRRDLDLAAGHAELALSYARKGVPVGVINAERMLAAVRARRGELDAAAGHLRRADEALAATEVANPSVHTAVLLTHALLAAKRGGREEAAARLDAAESRMQAITPARWLAHEHADVAALVATLPNP
jgi:serine/threonine-protein kinase